MALDTSIPLQAKVYPIESDTNRLAQVLALRNQQLQGQAHQFAYDQAQENSQRQNELRRILALGGGEQELLRGGFVTEATSLGKTRRENTKIDLEAETARLTNARKIVEAGLQAGASLLSTQTPLSKRDVVAALTPHVQAGAVPMAFATQFVQGLPDDDVGIRAALKRGMIASMDAKAQLEALLPKVEYKDTGGALIPVNTNTNAGGPGVVGGAATLPKTMTPGDVASNSLGRDRLNWDKQQPVIVPGVGAYTRTPGGLAAAVDTAGNPIRQQTDAEKEAAKRSVSAGRVTDVLNSADSGPNGEPISVEDLIKASTGSYAGWTRDQILRIGGYATDGSKAGAKLKVIQPAIMLAQPRMEGPQSDRDVDLYREAAAQVGDTTQPVEMRLSAVATLRRLQAEYAPGGAKYTPPRGAPAAAAGPRAAPGPAPSVDPMPGIRVISITPGPGR